MEGIIFQPVNYSGHAFTEGLHARRWITVYNGMEFETGATESRALHLPETMTAASRARLFRLLKGV